ncbi:MAG: hypothetical protein HOH65_20550 [Rhodospirillaceae bacterium]|jgi:hypothetical protein|nr:hypothetical protein [Rhodospirillaceae bacterium]
MSDDRKSEDYLEVVMKLKADPPLHRFRTYWGLVRGMRSALKTIDLELEASKERLRALEEDAAFVKRHRAKLDVCYRALRGTYAAPDRAMAAFNLLCRNISAEAAVQEIGLGSHRLGTALGRTFFGIRSQARKDAEANYASNVVTALSSIIKDQGAYLEMLAKNVESEEATAQHDVAAARAELQGLETAQERYEREMRMAARAIGEDQARQLGPEEEDYRQSVTSDR